MAELAGRTQGLHDRLARHAQACAYQHMKAKLDETAASVGAHVKTLNAILSERKVWAKLPENSTRDGSNNWERVSGDLAVMSRLHLDLNRQAVDWQGLEPEVADRLWAIVGEQNQLLSDLQEIVAKSDPQALD